MQQLLENTDPILAQLAASDHPVSSSGYPCAQTDDAVMQRVDESRLSADFIVVTGGSPGKVRPNRNNTALQIVADGDFKGLDTSAFERTNPVVLYGHGLEFPLPVASARNPDTGEVILEKTPTRLTSTAFFSEQFRESELIFAMVAAGFLNTASIQFQPHKALLIDSGREPTKRERKAGVMAFGRGAFMHFVESEKWEWSITAIPADSSAVRKCVERGNVNGVKIPGSLRQSLNRIAEPSQTFGVGFNADDFDSEPCGVPEDDDWWNADEPYAPMSEAELQSLDDDDDAEFWAALGGDAADAGDDEEFSKAVSALSATCDRVDKRLRGLCGDTK